LAHLEISGEAAQLQAVIGGGMRGRTHTCREREREKEREREWVGKGKSRGRARERGREAQLVSKGKRETVIKDYASQLIAHSSQLTAS
jgi:hypothetical protein